MSSPAKPQQVIKSFNAKTPVLRSRLSEGEGRPADTAEGGQRRKDARDLTASVQFRTVTKRGLVPPDEKSVFHFAPLLLCTAVVQIVCKLRAFLARAWSRSVWSARSLLPLSMTLDVRQLEQAPRTLPQCGTSAGSVPP